MTTFALVLASGCANQATGNYCDIAQKPFQWRDDEEINATPVRVIRYIETGAAIYERVC